MRSFAMTPPTLTSRTALLAVLLAGTIALGACGRRGRPEPPPDPNAPKTEQSSKAADRKKAQPAFQGRPGTVAQNDDDDDDDDQPEAEQAAGVSPLPTTRKKRQPFVVPKDPFILDSIL